jgi:hypothetical protein
VAKNLPGAQPPPAVFDEVFLPWFVRAAPNNVSEPTQSPSANVGRYTLIGELNPFSGFRQPATGC